MTSIKDAIKNWEAKEAKKAADAGLPEPPKAADAERVLLCVKIFHHSRARAILSCSQVRPAAAHSEDGQHTGHSESVQAPCSVVQCHRSNRWSQGNGFYCISVRYIVLAAALVFCSQSCCNHPPRTPEEAHYAARVILMPDHSAAIKSRRSPAWRISWTRWRSFGSRALQLPMHALVARTVFLTFLISDTTA